MKNVKGGAKNWNQYSNCMHVSIFLCYRVSVLKSLNYACKNLMYAYICMKVYSLAGQRETSITVSKRQTEVVRFGLLQGWSPGSFWQLLGATCTDPRPVKATSSALCFCCISFSVWFSPLSLSRLIAQNFVPVFPWFSNQFCLVGHIFFPLCCCHSWKNAADT